VFSAILQKKNPQTLQKSTCGFAHKLSVLITMFAVLVLVAGAGVV